VPAQVSFCVAAGVTRGLQPQLVAVGRALGAVLLEVVPDARWRVNYLHDMPKRDWRFWLLLVSEVVVTSTLLLHGEPLALLATVGCLAASEALDGKCPRLFLVLSGDKAAELVCGEEVHVYMR